MTAFAQIIATFSDLKNPDPQVKGLRKITVAGWLFYICTVVLAVLPAIQKELQDDIDEKKEKANLEAQDKRDGALRRSYDSSLLVMKGKFDTTTSIVSETLGKYGYKLDSSNLVLVNIRDSAKTRIIEADIPVVQLSRDFTAMPEYNPNGYSKFAITILSSDAGSSHFNIRYSLLMASSLDGPYTYINNELKEFPSYHLRISKDATITAFPYLILNKNSLIFIWMRGTYTRLDGSGNFSINDTYCYNIPANSLTSIVGNTRQAIIRMAEEHENKAQMSPDFFQRFRNNPRH